MKKILSSIFGLAILALTFSALLSQTVSAQAQTQEELRLQYVMNPNTDPEEFRQEMNNYFNELANSLLLFNEIPAVRKKFNEKGLQPLAQIEHAKQIIANLKPEELSQLKAAYAKVPEWRDAPRVIAGLIKPELRQNLESQIVKEGKPNNGVTTNAIITDTCPDPNLVPSHSDIAVAKAAEIAADLVMELLPTDVVTILFREAASIARAGVKAGVLAAETLKSIHDDCSGDEFETGLTQQITNTTTSIINNDNDNKTAVINNDNTNKTAITTSISNAQTVITTAVSNAQTAIVNNDNTNTTNIVTNDNANKTAIITNDNTNTTNIISNDNANKTAIITNDNANTLTITTAVENAKTQVIVNANANKDELLRLHIHADLAAVDSATPVAIFVLPAAKNGYLELVRIIVVQMITDLAGSNTSQANAFLAQGDTFRNAGNYKSAYSSYRRAYQTAAR